jgi:uncharacterized protein (DUF433 family)
MGAFGSKGDVMDRRKLAVAGLVAGSVGLGSLVGAVAFAPGVGLAASGTETGGRAVAICAGAAGSLEAAAGAIGIPTSDLVAALRDGDTIADVARANEVTVADVVDAIVAAEQKELDRLVGDGLLTQDQADELAADLEERATDLVNGDLAPFPMIGGRPPLVGRPGLWGFVDGPLAAAADAIGVDVTDLLSSLRDGDTIADVARANDVAVSEVVDAIVASMQERLDSAVDNGWITQRQADALEADLEQRAADLANGEPSIFPFPGGLPPLPGPGWLPRPGSGSNETSELSLF